jgi:hypothetical protein
MHHSRVVAPHRNPQFGGTIKGKWHTSRVFATPLCGGMRVRGASNENIATGEAPGTCGWSNFEIASIVFGQCRAFTSIGHPFWSKWIAVHLGLLLSSFHWRSGTRSGYWM